MKNFILTIACILAVCGAQAQHPVPAYKIISSTGRTELLSKRYAGMIKASIESVTVSGPALKITSKVSFGKVVVMRWTKNAQQTLVSDEQTVNYNPSTLNLQFLLGSPSYKGGLQYDFFLFVNASDKEYSWCIHVNKE